MARFAALLALAGAAAAFAGAPAAAAEASGAKDATAIIRALLESAQPMPAGGNQDYMVGEDLC